MYGRVESNQPSQRPKVHVQIFYGKDAETYRQNYLAGKEPDETPYGFHHAREQGFSVSFSHDAPRNPNSFMMRLYRKVFGFDVLHAYSNRDRIRQADVIWTMTEGEAFAIALLFSIGLIPRRPIVANAVWILNQWEHIPIWKRYIYRNLSKYITVMTVHSAECLPISHAAFPNLRSELMHFGINTDMFKITAPSPNDAPSQIRIFAPGNDATRDWHSLLAAFGNDERFHITIICQWLTNDDLKRYHNVIVIRSPSMAAFQRCYQEADIIVVPMRENKFSGITVALEAVAMGKPVLSSRTGGVPTYFKEDELFYAPVGDPVAMREIVLSTNAELRRQRAENAQRRFIETDYSTRAVVGRYVKLTRDLLGSRHAAQHGPGTGV
jgi:glycosyltransferase involved in cell wall biosynthesis